MNDLLLDLRYAVRTLRRAPGFALAAILTLALGIGANTAILSVVDGVLLRPAPFEDADRLAMVWQTDRNSGTTREPASLPDFEDFVERSERFGSLAAFAAAEVTMRLDQGDPLRLDAMAVTHEFLPMVGIEPVIGRSMTPEDDRPGAPPVVLIGDGLWDRLFGRDPSALGRTLWVRGATFTIVGVLPAGADFGTLQILDAAAYGRAFADRFGSADVQVWLPLRPAFANTTRDNHPIFVLGRLAPDASLAVAQQEMAGISADLEASYASNDGRGAHVEALHDVIFGPVTPALSLLFVAVTLVLLVACVNVANLLLARAATRTRELAVRTALGADSRRMGRQFLVEGLVLAFCGGGLGVALAAWGTRALLALAPGDIPRVTTVHVNGTVLLLTTALCVLVGVAFGIAPMLQARRLDSQSALKGAATGSTSSGAGQRRTRMALVTAELTLAVALVVGAGHLIQSFWRLQQVDPGFTAEGVLKAQIVLPPDRYPVDFARWPDFREMHDFNDRVLERIAGLPGVTAAAIAGNHPLDAGFTNSISVPGREDEAGSWPEISVRRMTPGYLATVELALRRGRALDERDATSAPPVVLINEAAVAQYFPDREPLGQQLQMWGALRSVVGVVENERTHGLTDEAPPALYLPLAQAPSVNGDETLLVRTAGDPGALAPALRRVVRETDPELAVFGIEALDRTVRRSVGRQRFTMLVLGAFAGSAIALALVGVHGVLSYLVARRSREIGLRLALGAAPGTIVADVVWQGLRLASLGLALGLLAALGGARLLRGLLFGVTATDPLTFAAVALAVAGAAAAASWIPARRAARADPMATLRSE